MKKYLVAFISALLFSLGLGVSGMTDPQKVGGFLDVFGLWNPTLMFVMIGAISVHFIFLKLIRKKMKPIFANEFKTSNVTQITKSLIIGAFIFGVGWGLGGYCPGPAITSLASLSIRPLIFVLSMIVGMRFLNYFKSETL